VCLAPQLRQPGLRGFLSTLTEARRSMTRRYTARLRERQFIRKYQQHVREKWLLQWRAGTGRAPWDDGPDPREEESRTDQPAEIG
jgi:hypothetical protein